MPHCPANTSKILQNEGDCPVYTNPGLASMMPPYSFLRAEFDFKV